MATGNVTGGFAPSAVATLSAISRVSPGRIGKPEGSELHPLAVGAGPFEEAIEAAMGVAAVAHVEQRDLAPFALADRRTHDFEPGFSAVHRDVHDHRDLAADRDA